MMNNRAYFVLDDLNTDDVCVSLGADKNGKPSLRMYVGTCASDVAFMSPACMTHWPRCNGNGNYGTMWGPTELVKARFTLDLTDSPVNGEPNAGFEMLAKKLDAIDDKLLDFVHNEQVRILGRRQLSREEVKMLQVRSVRAKYDRNSGVLAGHSVNLAVPKYVNYGPGKQDRSINVYDCKGNLLPTGVVSPGDIVVATMYLSSVYTGLGGDKFGISWGFEQVAIICQRSKMALTASVPIFQQLPKYDFAASYDDANAYHRDFSDSTEE